VRALLAGLALLLGGCMSVDATVEAVVSVPGLSFPAGDYLAGQMVSSSQTVPVKLTSPLLKHLTNAEIESVLLRPTTGVNTLDFVRGLTLTAHSETQGDVPMTSLGPALLQPAADGSLTIPVGVTFQADYLRSGLMVEATIEFIVPAHDWSISEDFTIQLHGGTTL
jgi:hypothetical protein